LDLNCDKAEKKGIVKLKKGENMDDEERYKLGKNTSIQTGMSRYNFMTDVLPYIFHLIHPNIREINTQLFTKHEKDSFQ
jgi:hypothetical protein